MEGQCGCTVLAGAGTTVDGDGTPQNPWVITSGDRGYLFISDTPTVDLTLSGDGTNANPYLLSAEVVGLPGPDEGGVDAIQFTDTPEIDFTVTGMGSEADPIVVSATLPLIDFTGGNPGDVLTMDANGSFYPGPPTQAPVGQVAVGFGISGDGTGANPFRINLCNYDELKAACAT
ncbi:MAG TPA: hypothetical protein VFP09_07865 [Desertimonas sp.]|nr:hypothetical protein [Desertimonas sp.]